MVRVKSWRAMGIILGLLLLPGCFSGEKEHLESKESPQPKPPLEVQQSNGDDSINPEQFIHYFLLGEFEKIYTQTSEDFKANVSLESLNKLVAPFNEGVEEYRFEAHLPIEQGEKYVWVDASRQRAVSVVFDEEEKIAGLWINPITTYPETDQTLSQTEFIFPFHGEWFTLWGGTNEVVNYHYAIESQRYAYDFIILKETKSNNGDPESNESYYAYGAEVVAPADGKVVRVKNDVKDNETVGKMNPFQPNGNYIVIDHGNGEFSMLAHLKFDSITVEEGDYVRQGDLIALTGNSGNSSEPHIHFQLMDNPDPDVAKSIRIRFKDDLDVIQGDFVTNK